MSRIVDLTHTGSPAVPTDLRDPQIALTPRFTLEQHRSNLKEWTGNEHTGTHMDAPLHFSENGRSADAVPPANLSAPLAVIDIRASPRRTPTRR
ncbi:MAG: cyclase family protein [Acetobacteraceae bacterium]